MSWACRGHVVAVSWACRCSGALSRACRGRVVAVSWPCRGRVAAVSRGAWHFATGLRHGRVVGMSWPCRGRVVALGPRRGNVVAVSWPSSARVVVEGADDESEGVLLSLSFRSDGLQGLVMGILYPTLTLPLTNLRMRKSLDESYTLGDLYAAYWPTLVRDIVGQQARTRVNSFCVRTLGWGRQSPAAMALSMFMTCVISSPFNELRNFYMKRGDMTWKVETGDSKVWQVPVDVAWWPSLPEDESLG
ncbi:unnamed protein product [Symbiodinium natans]|uniref:Uncharacterized protein n=1 Tax=Symbiodinium natans TaxID=878477 RepID=A0A812M7N5_9DINO|nr:unnamed protein product [Symbiodinium natans]